MSPLECDPSTCVGKAEALPFEVPAATHDRPIPSQEQTFPFLAFILAVAEEGRGRGCKTSRKRLFVWLASFVPTGERPGSGQSCMALPLPPAGLWATPSSSQGTGALGSAVTVGAFISPPTPAPRKGPWRRGSSAGGRRQRLTPAVWPRLPPGS